MGHASSPPSDPALDAQLQEEQQQEYYQQQQASQEAVELAKSSGGLNWNPGGGAPAANPNVPFNPANTPGGLVGGAK